MYQSKESEEAAGWTLETGLDNGWSAWTRPLTGERLTDMLRFYNWTAQRNLGGVPPQYIAKAHEDWLDGRVVVCSSQEGNRWLMVK